MSRLDAYLNMGLKNFMCLWVTPVALVEFKRPPMH